MSIRINGLYDWVPIAHAEPPYRCRVRVLESTRHVVVMYDMSTGRTWTNSVREFEASAEPVRQGATLAAGRSG